MDGLMVLLLLTQAAATWTSGYAFQQQGCRGELILVTTELEYDSHRLEHHIRRDGAVRLKGGYHSKLPAPTDALRLTFASGVTARRLVARLKPIWVARLKPSHAGDCTRAAAGWLTRTIW